MFRYMIKCGSKLYLPKNSRSLQTSTISRDNKKDGAKDEEQFDEKYWSTEVEEENPVGRSYRLMSKQFRQMKNKVLFWKEPRPVDSDDWGADSASFPSHVDVVILGSGAIANSIAYWMRKRGGDAFSTIVIDKDEKYSSSSPVIHSTGLRMQYSMDENLEMAMASWEFIREANQYLYIDEQPPVDLKFHHQGFLTLASEAGAEQLAFNSKHQNSLGIKNVILSAAQLKQKFPWLNTDGIAVGCLGLEKEGWYDSEVLIAATKKKAIELGAEYVTGEVKGFIFSRTPNTGISSEYKAELYRKLNHIVVKTADGEKKVVQFAILVIAAGYQSKYIAEMAKIGTCTGMLSVPLPIEPRKRYMYNIYAPNGPGINTPITQDISGCFFRRNGLANSYMVGYNPYMLHEEPREFDLDASPNYFFDYIWPKLSLRIPSFEDVKVKSSQAAFLDYNNYDENGILGNHPLFTNIFFATGFGHNNVNYSPAIGRAISELIMDGGFRTLDLTRLGFERFITQEPQYEIRIL